MRLIKPRLYLYNLTHQEYKYSFLVCALKETRFPIRYRYDMYVIDTVKLKLEWSLLLQYCR